MYAEIIEKSYASNMKLFPYPSNIKVFTTPSFIDNCNTQPSREIGLVIFLNQAIRANLNKK